MRLSGSTTGGCSTGLALVAFCEAAGAGGCGDGLAKTAAPWAGAAGGNGCGDVGVSLAPLGATTVDSDVSDGEAVGSDVSDGEVAGAEVVVRSSAEARPGRMATTAPKATLVREWNIFTMILREKGSNDGLEHPTFLSILDSLRSFPIANFATQHILLCNEPVQAETHRPSIFPKMHNVGPLARGQEPPARGIAPRKTWLS
jgi:hypothetical protein